MIALAALLVLVAVALLVGGLRSGDTTVLWASVGVSGLAAVVLVLPRLQRGRAAAARAADTPARETPVALTGAVAPAEGSPEQESATPPGVVLGAGPAPAVPAGTGTSDAAGDPAEDLPTGGSHSARPVGLGGPGPDLAGESPEEEVEVSDLLIVLDLTDGVVVVDEHPRYHLAGCAQTAGQEEILLPLDEARADGFTACGVCQPDSHLAAVERDRRAAAQR